MNSTKHLLRWLALALMPMLLFPLTPDLFARVVTVGIANGNQLKFFPAITNIAVGDQVLWVWNNTLSSHTTTDTGLWDSGLQASGNFSRTFNSAGSFPYQCTPHGAFGMTGTINVTALNQPPTVTITNPVTGTVLAAPASLTLQASATDPDGTVTNVQFWNGPTLLTNLTTTPFATTVTNLPAGSHTFSAIAFDNTGATATNSVSLSVVTPVPVVIGSFLRPTGTNFQFSYTANVGLGYVVQRATNLLSQDWITLATNVATGNPMIFSDTHATGNPGLYRVGRLPNP